MRVDERLILSFIQSITTMKGEGGDDEQPREGHEEKTVVVANTS